MSFNSSFLICLFFPRFVFHFRRKFSLYFSLVVCIYNDPPFTPSTSALFHELSLPKTLWFSVGDKLINVKFQTLTLRQSELNPTLTTSALLTRTTKFPHAAQSATTFNCHIMVNMHGPYTVPTSKSVMVRFMIRYVVRLRK